MERAGEPEDVQIGADGVVLEGTLAIPEGARAVVVFAHGSGSSRLSPRNAYVASVLHDAGLATLLFDLLTKAEAADHANVFDMPLLASRLTSATSWLCAQGRTQPLHIGYFGASTGAAAALIAAASTPTVGAVVSRGGRPDLAGSALPRVRAPTLLIVGGDDRLVLTLNQQAYAQLACGKQLCIVPGATHLFEEPGALEAVARLATDWFRRHLMRPAPDEHR